MNLNSGNKQDRVDEAVKRRIVKFYGELGVSYSSHWLDNMDSFELIERESELKKRIKDNKRSSNSKEHFDYLKVKEELGIK